LRAGRAFFVAEEAWAFGLRPVVPAEGASAVLRGLPRFGEGGGSVRPVAGLAVRAGAAGALSGLGAPGGRGGVRSFDGGGSIAW